VICVLLLCGRAVTEKFASRNPDEEVMKAFRLFDEEGTGKISLKARAAAAAAAECVCVCVCVCVCCVCVTCLVWCVM
jgi:hypothetical protein